MTASVQMKTLGTDPENRTWYYADESFVRPGIYYWDGRANIHAGDKIAELQSAHDAMRAEKDQQIENLNKLAIALGEDKLKRDAELDSMKVELEEVKANNLQVATKAVSNITHCGACAEIAFTGMTFAEHEEFCLVAQLAAVTKERDDYKASLRSAAFWNEVGSRVDITGEIE